MNQGLKAACTFLLFFGLSASTTKVANADIFNWTYSGSACNDDACGPADLFPPLAMQGSGSLTTGAAIVDHGRAGSIITGFAGTWNGLTITGLLPTDPDDPFYFFN